MYKREKASLGDLVANFSSAPLEIHRYLSTEIRQTSQQWVGVISDVGDDTLAVVAIMVTRSVCVVTYVGVCILVERFLDKGHMDVLLAEKMGQNNLFV